MACRIYSCVTRHNLVYADKAFEPEADVPAATALFKVDNNNEIAATT